MKRLLNIAAAALFLATVGMGTGRAIDRPCIIIDRGPACVPEVDPSMAAGALALVCGSMMVLRGRRKA